MIRLGIRIAKDIRYALLKIKNSSEYEEFLKKRERAMIDGEGNVPMKEYRIFEAAKDKILKRIDESTRVILLRLIGPHESTRKRGLYRARSIKGYERYMRVLKGVALEILPEIHSFLVIQLDRSISYFRIHRRL
jgi:hypothetical protein